MTDMKVLVPGLDHPISVDETPGRVTVRVGGQVVADSRRALTLREASHRPVQYIPLDDVAPEVLQPSSHTSWCPYKGKASYYDLAVGGKLMEAAIWTYRKPHKAVAEIADHVAFFADRVEIAVVPDGE
jgi:uncharacterized protein (DUF427 family)